MSAMFRTLLAIIWILSIASPGFAQLESTKQSQSVETSDSGGNQQGFFDAKIATSNRKTRIIRMTAHLSAKNTSSTPISKYIYRLTIPPNTESQYSIVEKSTTPVAATKDHKNGCSRFVEFHFPVKPKSEHLIDISFLVLVRPVDYLKVKSIDHPKIAEDKTSLWLDSSRLIETDSEEVVSAGKQAFAKTKDGSSKVGIAKVAYKYPRSVLKFKYQKRSLGAKEVLQTGVGDCTDFACLFAALCRTREIPARKVAVFNFAKNKSISKSVPNHHIAECYLETHGWIPVDPTLGGGKFNRPVGFGKLSNYFVIINREGAWVWQTRLPKSGYDRSMQKPKMEYTISWDGEVVEEGDHRKLTTMFKEAADRAAASAD